MISFLTGTVHHKTPESLTFLVAGVGYLVTIPPASLSKIPTNEELELHIHTHVREDALDLYGFTRVEELVLFKQLISVSGIGPKTALLVIDRGVDAVKQAIIKADEGFFTLVPRLGKKNAQKIIIELKSKLGSVTELDLAGSDNVTTEVVEALLGMGYTRAEALTAVRKLPPNTLTVEDQIRAILRQMNKK